MGGKMIKGKGNNTGKFEDVGVCQPKKGKSFKEQRKT
jgi:hypothetical protein